MSDPSKVVINLATGLEDAERVTVAFLVAGAAVERGREVAMFLTKEAVRLALPGYAEAVAWQRNDPARRWIFSLDEAMGSCVNRQRATYVGHANRREWWMFRADAVVPGCVPAASDSEDADDAP